MATMQDIIDRGRKPLNDAAKDRFDDPTLLQFANDFTKVARRVRPDLFFGSFAALPGDKLVGDTFPLPEEYEQVACDYVTGRAEAVNTEAELETRAAAFLNMADGGLGAG